MLHKQNSIPIALFAYARPDHLSQTLEGLKRNNVPLIYAFCDAPKDESKKEKVEQVRKMIREIDWAEVIITEREENWGLGTNIRAGVSEVLSKHDKVIVIEDDIVMRPGAYQHTCDALNYYEKDERVMTVSMWNHPIMVPKKAKNGFFSERFMCWGWGTYAKYWKLYTQNIQEIYHSMSKVERQKINLYGKDIPKQVAYSHKSNIWYVGYAMLHFIHKKVSYFPAETLVVNIGKDETAENDGPGKTSFVENYNLIQKPVQLMPGNWPEIKLLPEIPGRFNLYFHLRHHWWVRLVKRLIKLMYPIYRLFWK